MVRKTDRKDNSGKIKLEPSVKTANLRWINYSTPEPILFRLLLCKETIKEPNPKFCPCTEYKNKWATNMICKSKEKLAHIYFRYEQPKKINVGMRSCIVIFSINNLNPDDLVQRLKNTVSRLGIQKEKFFFYVIQFSYEKISVSPSYRHKLKKEIQNHYAGSLIKVAKINPLNENNDLMILKIGHVLGANEFSIDSVVETKGP